MFNKCGHPLPMDKKVNLSKSAAINRADDLGAENMKITSHETRAKNKCYMRQDPHQIKHVCSGHFWLPEHQPYWNAMTHLMNAEEFEKKLFPLEE